MNYILNPKYHHVGEFVSRISEFYDSEGEMLYNKRNVVKRFYFNGEALIVKRYKVPMWFQRIAYTFWRPSKALRAYRFAMLLQPLGIDTPVPVACIEVKRYGLFRQGYFVSTECSDPDVKCLKEDPIGNEPLLKAYVQFLVKMHEAGFMHGDLNLSNVLYRQNPDGTYHFTVIDINRSHFIQNPTREQCLQNLMRINRDREFSRLIVSRYAELRGWDVESSVATVSHAIDRYERKRRVRRLSKFFLRKDKKK